MGNKAPACIILGGGGHASVLVDALLARAEIVLYGILDADESKWGTSVLGVPILGGDSMLQEIANMGITHFTVGLGSTGQNSSRRELFERGVKHNLDPLVVLHPSSIVAASAKMGEGTQVLAGSVVNSRTAIGQNVIINTRAVVEHDCVIDDHAHIASGACLSGGVQVGEMAFVGAGAVVRQGVNIGSGAVVGAGAAVVSDVDPNTTVVGVPARSRI